VTALPDLLGTELTVARTIAQGVDAAATYDAVLGAIGTALGWEVGAVWEVDADGTGLRCVALWQQPNAHAHEFVALTKELTLAPGMGLPGRVWETGEPAWVGAVVDDENFPRAGAATRVGLNAAFAFPIRSPGEVVGVMEFLTRSFAEPDGALLDSMVVLGNLIGQFVVRQHAEVAVLEGEALNDAILASAIDAVITMDDRGVVVEFNPAATKMFGYSRAEAIGCDMAELIMPESLRAAHRHGLDRYLRTRTGTYLDGRVEVTGKRADGSEFPAEVTITQIDRPGEPMFTGFVRDITDRKQAEAEVRASRARLVEAADTERRRLERNLHDGAQQHLVGLALKLRLATERCPEGSETTQRLLAEAQEDLALALEDLRELARGIHPAVLSERGLAAALMTLAERTPAEVDVCGLPEDRLPDRVEVAAYYVVAEALTNTAKYAEAGRATVSVAVRGKSLIVLVEDDGRGGADITGGSGLRGLADRVEALGGTLVVDSAAGVGTKVRAQIPVEPVDAG
jgi:PAS domain S-box-containing protein